MRYLFSFIFFFNFYRNIVSSIFLLEIFKECFRSTSFDLLLVLLVFTTTYCNLTLALVSNELLSVYGCSVRLPQIARCETELLAMIKNSAGMLKREDKGEEGENAEDDR